MNDFVSRYELLGIPFPDPDTICRGECQGTGYVPVHSSEQEGPWRTLWVRYETENPSDDGWHFVQCPDCQGTGKRPKI